MAEVRLQAKVRGDAGKGSARRTRAAGRVPGVVYGRGMDPISISVDRREFVTALLSDSGMNTLLDLEIDGDTTLALTKELQRDPVRGTLLHADFVKVDRTVEVEVEVPVHVVGEAPGAREGGVLEHPLHTVNVRSLPGDVPEAIDADVSSLNLGDTLRVADLAEGRSFTILDDPETVVASVVAPISEEALASLEADAGVAGVEGGDDAEA
ncbi:MAG: 50S ribosomal protein L25/general stress protein Ctc, partial [Actinomycetota bacterium]|nr:50S ribosomal protein L25/general stress protein Ctc [Actinomycetota bacterium]